MIWLVPLVGEYGEINTCQYDILSQYTPLLKIVITMNWPIGFEYLHLTDKKSRIQHFICKW